MSLPRFTCCTAFPQHPSPGARTAVTLRLDGGARGEQRPDHLQVAFPRRNRQRPHASVRRARLQMATGRAKSQKLLRRSSEDFGSEILGVWATFSNGDMYLYHHQYKSVPCLIWIGKSHFSPSAMPYIQIKSQIQIEHDPSKKSCKNLENPFASICHNQFY